MLEMDVPYVTRAIIEYAEANCWLQVDNMPKPPRKYTHV